MTSLKRRATAAAVVATAAVGSIGFGSAAHAADNAPTTATPAQCAAYKDIYDKNKGPGIMGGYANNIKAIAHERGCDTSTWTLIRPRGLGGVATQPVNTRPVRVMP